jgi:hypothetical protein
MFKCNRKEEFMKNLMIIPLTLFICLTLIACNNSSNSSEAGGNDNIYTPGETIMEPIEVVENFFYAFEKADYESMQTSCSQECINIYFHDGDVFGMVWAKVTKVEETTENLKEDEIRVFVDVEMKTAETSALYGETETSFYVVLKKQSDGSWLVDKFVTG